ncbi:MAG: hypothetical protein ABIJ56_20970 [Pseudomonadota bacterium]
MVTRLLLVLLVALIARCASGEDGADALSDTAGDETLDASEGPEDITEEGPACAPNNDGVLERSEIVFIPGASVLYTMNAPGSTVEVDLVPGTGSEGEPLWDFSEPMEESVTLTYNAIGDQWYAAEFPGATYALPVSPGADDVGLYRFTDSDISLMGMASEEEGLTLMKYAPAVPILRFPLEKDDQWVVTSRIDGGLLEGGPYTSEDTYEVEVIDVGTVDLGYMEMKQTLTVRITTVQRFPGGTSRASLQVVWLHECYGEIVRVRSLDGETDPEFTEASEVRILAM